tara:strand:- start:872 stop:1003 length:132 start_codon:yes stop_codon:yes gene_type:complete
LKEVKKIFEIIILAGWNWRVRLKFGVSYSGGAVAGYAEIIIKR